MGRERIIRAEKKAEGGRRVFLCSVFAGGGNKRLRFTNAAFVVVALLLFCGDQLSKLWVVSNFAPGETRPLIPEIFHFTYVRNPGAAFGILAYRTSFFIAISLLLVLLILFSGYFLGKGHVLIRIALALQLGGALGNLSDRLRTGHVVDFIDFRFWPVFNMADAFIVVGTALLVLALLCRTPFFSGGKG